MDNLLFRRITRLNYLRDLHIHANTTPSEIVMCDGRNYRFFMRVGKSHMDQSAAVIYNFLWAEVLFLERVIQKGIF